MFSVLGERASGFEFIDNPIGLGAELAESFRDLRLVNRRFGGTAVVRAALRNLQASTILDVGTGVADIPLTLRREACAQGKDIRFTCLDTNEELLSVGSTLGAPDTGITFVRGDGKSLPFDDGSFDVVMCNSSFHHFSPPEAVALLREMRRVSRIAPVVTDLYRSPLSWVAAFAFSRLFTRNRLTRHDAPLSALRAYTLEEALALAREAGWRMPSVRRFQFIRLILCDDATV